MQVQVLFDRMASIEEDEDDEEDPYDMLEELLAEVSQHKAAIERLVPAVDLRQLFAPKAAISKRGSARRTGSLSTPTSSRRSARGDSSMRTAVNLEDVKAEAAFRLESLVAEVKKLVSVIHELQEPDTFAFSRGYANEHRDLQRMRGNFSFMLGTNLRQTLVEYVSEVEAMESNGPGSRDGRKRFATEVAQAVKTLDKAVAKAKIDRPYGFPRSTPSDLQGAQQEHLRSRFKNNILDNLASMSSSAGAQLSSQMLTVLGSKPILLDEFRVLVIDETASRIFSRCCGVADLVSAGICMVEDIENDRTAYPHLEAVYCVAPSVASINQICDDFPHYDERDDVQDEEEDLETKYKAAHVVLLGAPPSALLSKLKHSLGTMLGSLQQQARMDFIPDDFAFDLGMQAELQDAGLEDIESAPHHQEAMANKLSHVCAQLGITKPVIRWHNAAAPPENDRVYNATIGEERAARACAQIAELTHHRLLDVHSEEVVDAAEEERMQEEMDEYLDDLRAAVVRRNAFIARQRDAGVTEATLFEGMELDESIVRRKFGIYYKETTDYNFERRQDDEKAEIYKLLEHEQESDSLTARCEITIQDVTTGEEWELQYKKRPLDWGTAGTRAAGVHMYDFRLWRNDAGLDDRKATLAKLDQDIEKLEDRVKELELKQHRATEGEYALDDIREKDREFQLSRAEAAAYTRSRPIGRYQPDLTTGLLVVHRLVDLMAPLMHDTTYEAACADMFEEQSLQEMSKDVQFELYHCKQEKRKNPKPGKKPKNGWIDDIDESTARTLVLDSLRTTADWHKVRHKDIYKLEKDISGDFHSNVSSKAPMLRASTEVSQRDFGIHRAILSALRESCAIRNVQVIANWETEMIRGPVKTDKSDRRSGAADTSGSNRALWEKARDGGEFDIPALRRLLQNKVTDVNDKARVALIFILMRWDKQKTEKPSRGDAWDTFVIDEANRQGCLFKYDAHNKHFSRKESASSQASYADELEHKYEFTSFYSQKKLIESLMVDGLMEDGTGLADFERWTGGGRALSCIQLQQMRERAYVAEPGADPTLPIRPMYVRDEHEVRQYNAAVEMKWALFLKTHEKEVQKRQQKQHDSDSDSEPEMMSFQWEDGSDFSLKGLSERVERFIDFENSFEKRSTPQQKRQYKEDMKSFLSERQQEPLSVAMQNTMKTLLLTTRDGDQWTHMNHEKQAVEYAKFKKFELYFEAYYTWLCREVLQADTVLGDAWIQKLLKSLQIPINMVHELARTLDSPVEREYGYKAKKPRKQRASAPAKKAGQLQPTICGVARDFVEGTLNEEFFPRTKSQATPKDKSSQMGAKGIVTHSSMRLDRLVVFIVGGVSPWETRMIRKLRDELKCEIVIGSNELARPERTMDLFKVAPRRLGIKQAEETGDPVRCKKFPIKKKEIYSKFDRYATGTDRTMSRQAVEKAVTELSSKLKIKHRSALARALKAADKTRTGGVDKREFRILVDNVSQIDDLMRALNISDSDHRYQMSEQDFHKAACSIARDFIGGTKVTTVDADREFRKLQIEGYVLFDEFIHWMVCERKRVESSGSSSSRRLKKKRGEGGEGGGSRDERYIGGAGSLRADTARLSPGHRSRSPSPNHMSRVRRELSMLEPEPEPVAQWGNPMPEPEPEPELGGWRDTTSGTESQSSRGGGMDSSRSHDFDSRRSPGSNRSFTLRTPTAEVALDSGPKLGHSHAGEARDGGGRGGAGGGTRGQENISQLSPSSNHRREPTEEEVVRARKTRHKKQKSSVGCCAGRPN